MSEPFFIVGSARSGTTLLRMLFNAHPDIAVHPESRFIVELRPDHDPVEVESFLAGLTGHGRFAYWEISTDQIRKEIGDRSSVSYREAIEAVYRAYARAQGKSRWGDKTPRYVEHVEFLASLWPGARFVHVVRDGRDVALSYGDLPFGPKTVAKAAQLWAARVSAGRRNGRALGDRYLEIRYEDLVNDLETTTRTLCDFVEVEFDPAMLDYPERAQSAVLAARARNHMRRRELGLRGHRRSLTAELGRSSVQLQEMIGSPRANSSLSRRPRRRRRHERPAPVRRQERHGLPAAAGDQPSLIQLGRYTT
jgi:hypothetical protein